MREHFEYGRMKHKRYRRLAPEKKCSMALKHHYTGRSGKAFRVGENSIGREMLFRSDFSLLSEFPWIFRAWKSALPHMHRHSSECDVKNVSSDKPNSRHDGDVKLSFSLTKPFFLSRDFSLSLTRSLTRQSQNNISEKHFIRKIQTWAMFRLRWESIFSPAINSL